MNCQINLDFKSCESCGKIILKAELLGNFKKQKFCSHSCSKMGERNNNWKGDRASKSAGNQRAIRKYEITICEICNSPANDRHHKDGNVLNNQLKNIIILCRRCHMEIDGRLKKFLCLRPPVLQRDKFGKFLPLKINQIE